MEHAPPPFFKRGPSPLARLAFFSLLSVALLVADARLGYLDTVRAAVATVVHPLQRLIAAPLGLFAAAGNFFRSQAALRAENARLTEQHLANAARLQAFDALAAENAHLRELLEARNRPDIKSAAAEILYSGRDPFSRRVVIDRGLQNDVRRGAPVIDARGVVGQVTRVYPQSSEVTLVSSREQLTPVFVERTGQRGLAAGSGRWRRTFAARRYPRPMPARSGHELAFANRCRASVHRSTAGHRLGAPDNRSPGPARQ